MYAVDPSFSVNVPLKVFAWVYTINRDSESTLHDVLLLGKHHLLDPIEAECLVTGQVGRLNHQHHYPLSQVVWHCEDTG